RGRDDVVAVDDHPAQLGEPLRSRLRIDAGQVVRCQPHLDHRHGVGGGVHVDGEGTVLLTETVQLDHRRNPYADKARVEAELARTIGATTAIWLPRGLTRDYDEFGTNGHIDIVATIPSPGRLLLHAQHDPAHPDHAVSHELRELLAEQTDAAGRRFDIVDLPAPETLRDHEGFVD